MKLRSIRKTDFLKATADVPKGDFARTFAAKADAQNLWDDCFGAFINDRLAAALVVTVGKSVPLCANLQLLYTLKDFRKRGAGAFLCRYALNTALTGGAQYFRVSSEPPAVEFYRKLGFKFWGTQKSGCYLSLFRFGAKGEQVYDRDDAFIRSKLYSKRKGGLVEFYEQAQ